MSSLQGSANHFAREELHGTIAASDAPNIVKFYDRAVDFEQDFCFFKSRSVENQQQNVELTTPSWISVVEASSLPSMNIIHLSLVRLSVILRQALICHSSSYKLPNNL